MRAPLRLRELCIVILVACSSLAASGVHTVRSGETLAQIAIDHGVTVAELVEANGLANANLILVGQELTIPGEDGDTVHVVASGETLAVIARAYGTTVAALVEVNDIRDRDLIRIGQELVVPASSGTTPASSGSGSSGSSSGNGKQLVGQRHTVRVGESINSIADRYGIRAADFIRWNGLIDGKIYATSRLMLWDPGSLPAAPAATSTSTHTVASGQTLGAIAGRYGVSSAAVAQASGLADPNHIRVGQELTIPGGAAGGFRCPVPGASYFNDWAFPRSGGRSHAGIDLFAPRGTKVIAPADGWVDHATGSIGGHQFRLTAADGTLWFGSHLDSFGARGHVKAGDVVGTVGDSGNARGSRPHLHFEIHPGGTNAVNPYPLLRAIC